jgi:ketosteroid isomerase-like protein
MSRAVREQILRLEREQVRAVNEGDLRGATRMFDKGFVGFSSTKHPRIRGLRSLTSTFRYYMKHLPKMTYRIQQLQVHVSGAVAVATFYWTVDLGRRRTVRGRGTHVFTRKGKSWRVVHEHFSRAH